MPRVPAQLPKDVTYRSEAFSASGSLPHAACHVRKSARCSVVK